MRFSSDYSKSWGLPHFLVWIIIPMSPGYYEDEMHPNTKYNALHHFPMATTVEHDLTRFEALIIPT